MTEKTGLKSQAPAKMNADHELILAIQIYFIKTSGLYPKCILMREEFYDAVKRSAIIYAWDDVTGLATGPPERMFYGIPYLIVPGQTQDYILEE